MSGPIHKLTRTDLSPGSRKRDPTSSHFWGEVSGAGATHLISFIESVYWVATCPTGVMISRPSNGGFP